MKMKLHIWMFVLLWFTVVGAGRSHATETEKPEKQVRGGKSGGPITPTDPKDVATYEIEAKAHSGTTSCDSIKAFITMFHRRGAPLNLERCEGKDNLFNLSLSAPRNLKCETKTYYFTRVTVSEAKKDSQVASQLPPSWQDMTARALMEALGSLQILLEDGQLSYLPITQQYHDLLVPQCPSASAGLHK
jgi:hypothetical protein